MYFAPPLKGFPLEFGIGARGQKLEWWGYRAKQEVWRYLQLCRYNAPKWQTDGHMNGRTDGQTDTGPQQRPRLRIASRGKKTIAYRTYKKTTTKINFKTEISTPDGDERIDKTEFWWDVVGHQLIETYTLRIFSTTCHCTWGKYAAYMYFPFKTWIPLHSSNFCGWWQTNAVKTKASNER